PGLRLSKTACRFWKVGSQLTPTRPTRRASSLATEWTVTITFGCTNRNTIARAGWPPLGEGRSFTTSMVSAVGKLSWKKQRYPNGSFLSIGIFTDDWNGLRV